MGLPVQTRHRFADRALSFSVRPERIAMLLENNPYPEDVRVLAEARSLLSAGHSVTVIAPRAPGQPRREQVDGVDVVRFRAFDGSTHGALGYMLEYLLAATALHLAAVRALLGGATVLHIHNPPDILFVAGALFRIAGRKVIFDHHDLFPETLEVKFGLGVASRIAAFGERLTFAVANHVIATNGSFADVAATRGGKSPSEITIVRNAPPSEWTQRPLQAREGALDEIQLAYAGAISAQDGAEGLAPVLAGLRDHPDPVNARLTIIGDGDGRPLLEAELARLGVADRVTFTGWVDADRVPELLTRADVCVDPAPATDVNERSTMMKIAEYLSLGKPVVAYDLLEARRTSNGAAMLVPPGDTARFAACIAELARNPELRLQMARTARRRAAELTWDHSERALLEAYGSLRPKGLRGG
jgi:glycosyltransferase involved in cell wall biosynthesis